MYGRNNDKAKPFRDPQNVSCGRSRSKDILRIKDPKIGWLGCLYFSKERILLRRSKLFLLRLSDVLFGLHMLDDTFPKVGIGIYLLLTLAHKTIDQLSTCGFDAN